MTIAKTSVILQYVRKLSDQKLRGLQRAVNDPQQLAQIAADEGKTTTEAATVRRLVNKVYNERFGGS